MSHAVGNATGSEGPDPRQALGKAIRDRIDTTEPEQILWSGGYSPKAMFGTWLLSILCSAAIIVACFFLQGQLPYVWPVGSGLILLWWLSAVAIYAYRRIGYFYELTNLRFIHQKGILLRTTDRIEVIDIDDVMFSQGIVQRLLGVGTIQLTSSDKSHPILELKGIDRVKEISGLIDDTRLKQRRRRSLNIEMV